MNKHIYLFLIAITLCSVALTYDDDIEIQQPQHQEYRQQQGQQQQRPDYEAMMRQQASMKRTACLVLSRYHSNTHKQIIEEIIASLSPSDQQTYINKLYAVAVEKCLPQIQIEQAQQFFMQQQNFDPSTLFYILDGLDYPSIANDLENLTPNQKAIIRFIKQFDQQMQVRKQQKQAEKQETQDGQDLGIFMLPFSSFNSLGGIIYIVVLSTIVIGALVWGFTQLNNSQLPKNKKKKSKEKSPKKD